jgi:hypothetical protein
VRNPAFQLELRLNLTLNIPDDLLKSLREQASAECRSVSKHIVYLIQRDLSAAAFSVAAAAPKRKLSTKAQEVEDYCAKPVMDRPFVRHLVTHRGFATECLQPMTKEAVHTVYTDFVWPGPDGTLNGSYAMSLAEQATDQAMFNLTTGQRHNAGKPQPPLTFDAPALVNANPRSPLEVKTSLDENGDLNFED